MAFGRSKTPSTPAEKIAALAATKEAALSVFASAATDLESVRNEADAVVDDIEAQLAHLREVRDEAARQANEADSKAALIRGSFLGG